MLTPTEFELQQLAHRAIDASGRPVYDPVKAHQYYEQHKHLKGRRRGATPPPPAPRRTGTPSLARARQKAALQASVTTLSNKLQLLENLIRTKEAVLRRDQSIAKSKAKKERGAKEKNKPKTAAEKAQAARDAKKYRQQHQQALKTKAKQANKSGGSSSSKKTSDTPREMPIKELKALATKVRGQLAIAKQKLAAL
jgi:hypothetical protein